MYIKTDLCAQTQIVICVYTTLAVGFGGVILLTFGLLIL